MIRIYEVNQDAQVIALMVNLGN